MLEQNLQAEFVETLLSQDEHASIIHPVANISIYYHQIEQTLINTLKNAYPIIHNLIGHDCFMQVAQCYIQQYPSTSSNLNEYGEFFDEFISNYPNTSSLSYLKDVCKFEWIHHCLHDAPSHQPLSVEKLASISPEDYTRIHFELLPACRLLHSEYPLIDIVELGLEHTQQPVNVSTGGIHLMIYRPELITKTLILAPEEYAFFDAIMNHSSLELALAKAHALNPGFQLDTKLPIWVHQKIIVDCRLE